MHAAPDLDLVTKEEIEGVYGETLAFVAGNPDPKIKAWAEKMKAKFNVEPDVLALTQYEATT